MALRPTDHGAKRERFVEDLLDIMSMEEKIGQLVLRPLPTSDDPQDIRHIRDQLKRGHLGGLIGEFCLVLGNGVRVKVFFNLKI